MVRTALFICKPVVSVTHSGAVSRQGERAGGGYGRSGAVGHQDRPALLPRVDGGPVGPSDGGRAARRGPGEHHRAGAAEVSAGMEGVIGDTSLDIDRLVVM